MIKKIISRFLDLRIATKMILYCCSILIISIFVCTFIYQKINASIMTQKVSEMSMQTIKSINSNLDLLIDNVDNQSKVIISNQTLQHVLSGGNTEVNYNNQQILNRYFTEFINFNSSISSVYMLDNYGNKYYADKLSFKNFQLSDIKNAKWYSDLLGKNGGYLLKLNCGGVFEQESENCISMIRILNNIDNQQPIGILIINISEKDIIKALGGIGNENDTRIFLKNEENKDIVRSNVTEKDKFLEYLDSNEINYQNSLIKKIDSKEYIISYMKNRFDWQIIRIIPFNELSKQSDIFKIVMLIVLFINGVLVFLGVTLISLFITRPINKLVKSMETVERGEFIEVKVKTGNDEIGKLKDVYNVMIREIQNLINNIVKEQRVKRKADLDMLLSQIKPHFLYNSFDSISSLALYGKNEEVYTLVKALGSFYRTSLNNGREIITVEEELKTIKSYLTIQKIRYGDMFSVEMDIDESTYNHKILKLILQPIVENAIYHGIRCKQGQGIITIKSFYKENYIQLVVKDNGVGMSEDQVLEIKNGESKGVGLRATIGRLNIYYNSNSIFDLESKKDVGTTVTINIPLEQEDRYGK